MIPLSPAGQQRALFAFLCVVWGTTWLAMKVGVTSVPPGFFSGTRWTAAGLVLLAWRRSQGRMLRIPLRLLVRLTAVAVLMVSLNAVIMLYGLRHVTSGLAAVVASVLTPIALLGFAVSLGQERFNRAQLLAMAVGTAGILLLFGPRAASGELGPTELLGALGLATGCVCYCAGSVLARPLMRTMSPAEVAAMTNTIGGLTLLVLSVAFEPGAREALSGNWGAPAWAAWLFLLLPGSLGATIIYFFLVREWGASRAGTYAFVSPVLAVILGIMVLGEVVTPIEMAGMALMLVAAGLVLRRPSPVTVAQEGAPPAKGREAL